MNVRTFMVVLACLLVLVGISLWQWKPGLFVNFKKMNDFVRNLNQKLTGQTKALKDPLPLTGNWLEEINEPIRIDDPAGADSIPVNRAENPFYTMPREDETVLYPCTSCHDNFTGVLDNWRYVHFEPVGREFDHGKGDIVCSTCHHPERPDRLRLRNWKPVSFDRAYRVCAQCHFKQVRNWKGGAHSKQISSWKKPRIRYTCTNCHNPHNPSFEKRWPLGFPRKEGEH